ncbi:RNA:NAD 2'-phosphotransferase [Actibacterium atlanticum]|uniref:RNA:NAD 2'-phosphotransferase n=1 Tax=Actibacterium atlanticum TaxID=1461693 RepID=A0A058ZN15_9RHOB|nr:hypothetical protein [Actibacterium atlanticum]KCV82181.1 RNA:NAD 2'-phosphotransferase [Actibacterium atlanticum]
MTIAADIAPPATLYFGCGAEEASDVLISGLQPDTQLSADPDAARQRATAAGKQVVFTVYAEAAYSAGCLFRQDESGAWVAAEVAPDFLYLPPVRGAE